MSDLCHYGAVVSLTSGQVVSLTSVRVSVECAGPANFPRSRAKARYLEYMDTHKGTYKDTHKGTYKDTCKGTYKDTCKGTYKDTCKGRHKHECQVSRVVLGGRGRERELCYETMSMTGACRARPGDRPCIPYV